MTSKPIRLEISEWSAYHHGYIDAEMPMPKEVAWVEMGHNADGSVSIRFRRA